MNEDTRKSVSERKTKICSDGRRENTYLFTHHIKIGWIRLRITVWWNSDAVISNFDVMEQILVKLCVYNVCMKVNCYCIQMNKGRKKTTTKNKYDQNTSIVEISSDFPQMLDGHSLKFQAKFHFFSIPLFHIHMGRFHVIFQTQNNNIRTTSWQCVHLTISISFVHFRLFEFVPNQIHINTYHSNILNTNFVEYFFSFLRELLL